MEAHNIGGLIWRYRGITVPVYTSLSAAEVTVEAALMEALADIEENERLDKEGAIEISSDEGFAP